MPLNIAPVIAPFRMPLFEKPVFPKRRVDIREHGAKPIIKSTTNIQAAINQVNKLGVVP